MNDAVLVIQREGAMLRVVDVSGEMVAELPNAIYNSNDRRRAHMRIRQAILQATGLENFTVYDGNAKEVLKYPAPANRERLAPPFDPFTKNMLLATDNGSKLAMLRRKLGEADTEKLTFTFGFDDFLDSCSWAGVDVQSMVTGT